MNSNRVLMAPVIVIMVIGLILMPAILPIVKMNPKHVPIGLVVLDEGEIGKTLTEKLLENAPDVVEFKQFETEDSLNEAMFDREIYGGFVLPEDFSSKIETLQSEQPEKAVVRIYINEGANAQAATSVETALTNMVTMMNDQLSEQMLTQIQAKTDEMKEQLAPLFEAQGDNSPLAQVDAMISPIEPSKVHDFAHPIESETIKVNEANELGNAPIAYLMVTWFSSMIGAIVLYLAGTKRSFSSKAEKWKFHALQSILPFIYALIAGYTFTWYSTWIFEFELESFHKVTLYIAVTVSTFIFMIFATLRWLSLPSIVIFILLMFFSMPSVMLVPEMMPAFYRDYIVTWLPMRIYAEGLRELLFFSKDFMNGYTNILIWILVIALVLVWMKNIVEKPKMKDV